MKKITILLKMLTINLLVMLAFILHGQEASMPFCENVQIIDAKLGSKLSTFQSYKDFQQAVLLKGEDGLTLSITYKIDGIFQFERKRITEGELNQICQEIIVLSQKKIEQKEEDFNQEARRRFITSAAAFSLGFYSPAVPYALNAEGKAYAASYLFIGGSGFFIPLIATKNRVITDGMARAYTVGATLGGAHGLALDFLFEGENIDDNALVGLAVLGSITESFTGLYLAKKHNYSWGKMSIIGSGGLWGLGLGASLPYIIADSDDPRAYGLSMLSFSAAGMMAGNYLYSKMPITHGDATVINSLGVLGAYYPLVLLETVDTDNDKAILAGVIIGASGGIAWGIHKAKNYNYSRQQGNLISLGEGAGYLIGAGLAVLMDAETTGYFWLTGLSATGGLFLTELIVKDMGEDKSSSASNFNFHLNPYGLMGALKNANSPYKPWDPRYSNSIATLSWKF